MQDTDLVIFQEVQSMEEALDVEAILLKENIHCKIIETKASFDVSTGQAIEDKLTIQVIRADFDKAREVMIHSAEVTEVEMHEEHYFHEFTNDELLDVLKSEDDWSPEDLAYARKLLANKNISWNEDEIFSINEEKRNEKDKTIEIPTSHYVIGIIVSILGGLLGLFYGIFILTAKKDDRYGNRIHIYGLQSRKKANLLCILGSSALIALLYYKFVL